MANEQLTIQPNDARMTVIGKSWPDQASDSGGGEWDDTYNGTYSGPIPRTDLPTKIAVTTMPDKTEYSKSERIDFTGMVVTAYKDDGSVWTSSQYPNGIIPLNEIISTYLMPSDDNTVQYYSYIDPYYRTIQKFIVCKHVHIEGNQGYVEGYGHSHGTYDFTAQDGCVLFVRAYYYIPDRPETQIDVVFQSEKAESPDDLVGPNVYAGRYTYDYTPAVPEWDIPEYHGARDLYTSNNIYSRPNKENVIMYYRSVGSGYSPRFEGSQYSCNIPISLIFMPPSQRTSIGASGYVYATNPQDVSVVNIYWQRPGDGLYLSCTLPVFIKSDESD